MIGQYEAKWVQVTPPAAIIDNASATTNVIDTLGYDRCEIIVFLGALDIAMTALKVQEADAKSSSTALTSGADISGTVGGTDFTLPIATDDNNIIVFDLNLVSARKRYLDLVATLGDGATGTYFTALARLSKGKVDPTVNAAAAGLLARIVVP